MTDMIERVARAIAAVHIAEVKGIPSAEAAVAERVESRWISYREEARAAIAALREPTYKACGVGAEAIESALLGRGNKTFLSRGDRQTAAAASYAAMIDAALEPPNGPAAPIWRKAGAMLAEGDAMIDAAIERAEKAPNGPARRDPAT